MRLRGETLARVALFSPTTDWVPRRRLLGQSLTCPRNSARGDPSSLRAGRFGVSTWVLFETKSGRSGGAKCPEASESGSTRFFLVGDLNCKQTRPQTGSQDDCNSPWSDLPWSPPRTLVRRILHDPLRGEGREGCPRRTFASTVAASAKDWLLRQTAQAGPRTEPAFRPPRRQAHAILCRCLSGREAADQPFPVQI